MEKFHHMIIVGEKEKKIAKWIIFESFFRCRLINLVILFIYSKWSNRLLRRGCVCVCVRSYLNDHHIYYYLPDDLSNTLIFDYDKLNLVSVYLYHAYRISYTIQMRVCLCWWWWWWMMITSRKHFNFFGAFFSSMVMIIYYIRRILDDNFFSTVWSLVSFIFFLYIVLLIYFTVFSLINK